VVTTAPDGDRQVVLPGEPHRLDDVVGPGTPAQDRRSGPDTRVEEHPRTLVAGVGRGDDGAAEPVTKLGEIRAHRTSSSLEGLTDPAIVIHHAGGVEEPQDVKIQ
jgi:hypothetical protein